MGYLYILTLALQSIKKKPFDRDTIYQITRCTTDAKKFGELANHVQNDRLPLNQQET